MSSDEVRAQYLTESWGKFLSDMGLDPYETESMARKVAECAAAKIEALTPKKPEPGEHHIEALSISITVGVNGSGRLQTEMGVSYGDEVEAVILAHFLAGINISSPEYVEGVITAIDAISNNPPSRL